MGLVIRLTEGVRGKDRAAAQAGLTNLRHQVRLALSIPHAFVSALLMSRCVKIVMPTMSSRCIGNASGPCSQGSHSNVKRSLCAPVSPRLWLACIAGQIRAQSRSAPGSTSKPADSVRRARLSTRTSVRRLAEQSKASCPATARGRPSHPAVDLSPEGFIAAISIAVCAAAEAWSALGGKTRSRGAPFLRLLQAGYCPMSERPIVNRHRC